MFSHVVMPVKSGAGPQLRRLLAPSSQVVSIIGTPLVVVVSLRSCFLADALFSILFWSELV